MAGGRAIGAGDDERFESLAIRRGGTGAAA